MRHNMLGQVCELDLPQQVGLNAVHGTPLLGLRRLHLADAIATGDPGTRLTSALVDLGEGSGIDGPMSGSWGSTDWTGAYAYASWVLRDVYGRPIGGNVNVCVPLYIRLRTALADTDDFAVGLAICNESDPTTATIEGKGTQIVGNGAGGAGSLRTGNTNTANGVGTVSNAASSAAGVVWAVSHIGFAGAGGASRIYANGSLGLDTAGAGVTNSGVAPIGAQAMAATPSIWYLVATWGRNDATNVNALAHLAADLYVGPVVCSPLALG